MALDLLLDETRGLPDELIMQIVRYARFIRSEHARDTDSETTNARRVAGKRRGQIRMAADFDDPLDDFAEYM